MTTVKCTEVPALLQIDSISLSGALHPLEDWRNGVGAASTDWGGAVAGASAVTAGVTSCFWSWAESVSADTPSWASGGTWGCPEISDLTGIAHGTSKDWSWYSLSPPGSNADLPMPSRLTWSTWRFHTLPSFNTIMYDLGPLRSAIEPCHQLSSFLRSFTETLSPGVKFSELGMFVVRGLLLCLGIHDLLF